MKIIIVHIGDINYCPPALNVINSLIDLNHEVIVCTTKTRHQINLSPSDQIKIKEIGITYEKPMSPFLKIFRMFDIRKQIWSIIDENYDDNTLLWVISDTGIKHLGKRLLTKNYILHLMELSEDLLYYKKLRFLKLDKKAFGNFAKRVVVPEYNRAHIIKEWWELNELPFILENKPYISIDIAKNSIIEHSEVAFELMEKLKDRKIILYQGIMHRERPLDKFIDAVDQLGDEYAFVVMTKGENIYKESQSKNYFFIPFIEPPYHLEVTSHAFIGVLSYFPVKSQYSILNALFAAPNKTFEYAKFSVPMISNDVPGLKYLFDTHHCGISVTTFNEENICEAIRTIEADYSRMATNAREFYDEVDVKLKVKNLLQEILVKTGKSQ